MAIKSFGFGNNLDTIAQAIPTAIQGYYDAEARKMQKQELAAKMAANEDRQRRESAMDRMAIEKEYVIPEEMQGQDPIGLMNKGFLKRKDPYESDPLKNAQLGLVKAQTSKALADAARSKDKPSSPFEKEQQRQFAKALVEFKTKDGPNLASNLKNIDEALNILEKDGEVGGFVTGIMGETNRKLFNKKAAVTQQYMNKAIQDSLRPTLGAQFTEKEGERIMNLTYDPFLPDSVNEKRAKMLKDVIQTKLTAMDALQRHLEKNNGRIAGFDFDKYNMKPEIGGSEEMVADSPSVFKTDEIDWAD